MEEVYIQRVLDGDQSAFVFLVRENQAMAMRTAMAITKNEAVAKDMVQNSFVQAYLALPNFKQEAKFSTWLCRIVINNCLRYTKQAKTQQQKEIEWGEVSIEVQNKGWTQLGKEDAVRHLKAALQSIPAKEALCLQLYYLEEYSLDEIFQLTAFSKSNIKVLLHRGRKHLHQYLTTIIDK